MFIHQNFRLGNVALFQSNQNLRMVINTLLAVFADSLIGKSAHIDLILRLCRTLSDSPVGTVFYHSLMKTIRCLVRTLLVIGFISSFLLRNDILQFFNEVF